MKLFSAILLFTLVHFAFGIGSQLEIKKLEYDGSKVKIAYEKHGTTVEATDSGPMVLCAVNRLLKHKYGYYLKMGDWNKDDKNAPKEIADADLDLLKKASKLITPTETAQKFLASIEAYRKDKSSKNADALFDSLANSIVASMPKDEYKVPYTESFLGDTAKKIDLMKEHARISKLLAPLEESQTPDDDEKRLINKYKEKLKDLDKQIAAQKPETKTNSGTENPVDWTFCLHGEGFKSQNSLVPTTKTQDLLNQVTKILDKIPARTKETKKPEDTKPTAEEEAAKKAAAEKARKEQAEKDAKAEAERIETQKRETTEKANHGEKPSPPRPDRPTSTDLSFKDMYKIVDEIEKKAQEAGPEKYQETLKELSNKELEKQTGKNKDKLKELFDLRFTKSADDLLKAAKEDKPSIAKELVQELEKDARVAFLTKHFPLSPELAILFLRAMETSPPAAGKALGELVYSLDKAQREALIKAIKENAEKDKTNPMFNTLLKWVDSKETENKHTDKATSSKFAEAYDKQVEDKKKANEAYWKTVEDLDKNAAEIAKAEPAKVKELQEQRAKKQEELKPFEEASSTFARFNVSETNDKNKDNALTNGSRTAMAFADVSSEGKAWLNLAPEAITPGNRKPSRLFLGTVDKDKPGEVLKTAAGALSKFDSNRDEGDLNKFRVVKKHPEAVTPNPVYIDKGGNFKKEKPTELASKEFKPTVTAPPTATPPPATPPPKKEEPKTGLTDAEKAVLGGSDGAHGVAESCNKCHTSKWDKGNFIKDDAEVTYESFKSGLDNKKMLDGLRKRTAAEKEAMLSWLKTKTNDAAKIKAVRDKLFAPI